MLLFVVLLIIFAFCVTCFTSLFCNGFISNILVSGIIDKELESTSCLALHIRKCLDLLHLFVNIVLQYSHCNILLVPLHLGK